MSQPDPAGHGIVARIEEWFARHLAPELAKLRGDVDKVLEYGAAHEALAEQVVAAVAKLAELADPAEAPAIAALVARIDAALEEAKAKAAELTGSGM